MLTYEQMSEGVLNLLSDIIPLQKEKSISTLEECRVEAQLIRVLEAYFNKVDKKSGD